MGKRQTGGRADIDDLLTVVSLLEPGPDVTLIAQILEWPRDRVVGAAIADPQVRFDGSRVRFASPSMLTSARDALESGPRAALHDRICRVLVELSAAGSDDWPVRTARHAVASLPVGSAERAVTLLTAAGHHEAGRGQLESARKHFASALELARGALLSESEVLLMLELGELASAQRAMDEALEHYTAATALAVRRGMWPLAARAAAAAAPGVEGVLTGEPATTGQLVALESAIDHLGPVSSERAIAEGALAVANYWADTSLAPSSTAVNARQALVDTAVGRARSSRDIQALTRCLGDRLAVTWGPDSSPGRSTDVAEMAELANRQHHVEHEIEARGWRVVDLLGEWKLREIEREVWAVERLARPTSNPFHRWTTLKWRSMLALTQGRLDDAETLAHRAHKQAGKANVGPRAVGMLAGSLSAIRYLQGRLDERRNSLSALIHEVELPPSWTLAYAYYCAASGELTQGRQFFELVADVGFDAIPRNMTWLTSMTFAARAAVVLEDEPRMIEIRQRLAPYRDQAIVLGHAHSTYGPVALVLGELSVGLGDTTAALDHFATSTRLATTGPFGALGRLGLSRLGQIDPAPVREELTEFGMHTFAAMTEAQIRKDADQRVRLEIGPVACALITPERRYQIRASKGMRYIAMLIEAVGRDYHVLDLVDADAGNAGRTAERRHDVELEWLDATALRSYRDRLKDLDVMIDDATTENNQGLLEQLRTEREAIIHQVGKDLGTRGPRRTVGASERARSAVTQAIHRAMRDVSAADPHLGDVLRASVQTGAYCLYEPDRIAPWQVVRLPE